MLVPSIPRYVSRVAFISNIDYYSSQFTPEAADVLVEKYRHLRQDDATGVGRNSYRITVRQLESMIRLSEAIARANCTAEITPAFVKEAYSLLRQSIIHVEKDDVNLDEEDDSGGAAPAATVEGNAETDGTMDVDMDADGLTSPSRGLGTSHPTIPTSPGSPSRGGTFQPQPLRLTTPAPQVEKKKLKITHDKYMTMQSLIVLHLSEVERTHGRGEEREALIDWYLEKKEEEGGIGNLEELEYEKELFAKVIAKLVKVSTSTSCGSNRLTPIEQDNYLIAISEEVMESLPTDSQEDGPATSTTGTSLGAAQKRLVYMVHPSVDADTSSYA